jgi:hypothetical protein
MIGKRIRKGSGLSVREELKITDATPEEMRALIGDGKQFGLTAWFDRVRENCRAVLEGHGLPGVAGVYYQFDGGPWRSGEEAKREAVALWNSFAPSEVKRVAETATVSAGQRRRLRGVSSLLTIAEEAGHTYDSPAGFAARLLDHLGDAQIARKHRDFDRHAFAMAKFGETLTAAQFAAVFQADAERGSKSMAGSKLGGQMSRASRRVCSRKDDREIREAFDAKRAAHPKLKKMAIDAELAGRFGFGEKTIRRSLKRTSSE